VLDGIDIGIVIWLLTGLLAGVGEMLTGTLFLVPIVIGAVIAAVAVALGADSMVALTIFGGVTLLVLFWVLRFGRRSAAEPAATHEGARRYVDARGRVTAAISNDRAGQVKIGGELWRGISHSGRAIEPGTPIRVVAVSGNALVVEPAQPGAGSA
jgi:membrane protein implicated in regulation of membrane protease activity